MVKTTAPVIRRANKESSQRADLTFVVGVSSCCLAAAGLFCAVNVVPQRGQVTDLCM